MLCAFFSSIRFEQALEAGDVFGQLATDELAHAVVGHAVRGEQGHAADKFKIGQVDERIRMSDELLVFEHHAVLVLGRGVERVLAGVDRLGGHVLGA